MNLQDWQIRESSGGIDVPFHVQPRASCNRFVGIHNGAMKIRLTSPPVEDAANRSLVEHISAWLNIPRSHCILRSGLRSKNKTLHITGLSKEQFLQKIPDER